MTPPIQISSIAKIFKLEKYIEMNISVFKYVCLAFFVYAMMYPIGKGLRLQPAQQAC